MYVLFYFMFFFCIIISSQTARQLVFCYSWFTFFSFTFSCFTSVYYSWYLFRVRARMLLCVYVYVYVRVSLFPPSLFLSLFPSIYFPLSLYLSHSFFLFVSISLLGVCARCKSCMCVSMYYVSMYVYISIKMVM